MSCAKISGRPIVIAANLETEEIELNCCREIHIDHVVCFRVPLRTSTFWNSPRELPDRRRNCMDFGIKVSRVFRRYTIGQNSHA